MVDAYDCFLQIDKKIQPFISNVGKFIMAYNSRIWMIHCGYHNRILWTPLRN